MAGFAGSALTAAVANAGGFGILAGHGIGPAALRDELAATRAATNRPFGVNLLLADDLVRPASAESIAQETVEGVNQALNPMRERMGLPPKNGLPDAPARDVAEKLEIVLEARPQVLSIGLGNPGVELIERCHRLGIFVIAMVSTVEDAIAVAESGVDAIVAQGAEAGGHRSHFRKPVTSHHGLVGTMALVPEIADAVRIPVIAAGGIADGRGLVAALALGAQGAMFGTRFVASRESLALPVYRQVLTDGTGSQTTVTDVATGRYARALRNGFTEGYGDGPVLPFGWQGKATGELFERARERGDRDHMVLWSGQSVGLIHDTPSAAEIVSRVVDEATQVFERLNR